MKKEEPLRTNGKYYTADFALQQRLLGGELLDREKTTENLVYLQLLRMGYDVYIGKNGNNEIDFLAIKDGERLYVQVAASALNTEVAQKECAPLSSLGGDAPRLLITADEEIITSKGVIHVNLYEFLMKGYDVTEM